MPIHVVGCNVAKCENVETGLIGIGFRSRDWNQNDECEEEVRYKHKQAEYFDKSEEQICVKSIIGNYSFIFLR